MSHIALNGYRFEAREAPQGAAPEDAESDEAAFSRWWANVPDFIRPDYPFDVPPGRLPFAQYVFTQVGAPRFCPETACRRCGECRGGDGPPCLRADRKRLLHVLFLWWMRLYAGCTDEEYAASLRTKQSPYAPDAAPKVRRAKRVGRRRQR